MNEALNFWGSIAGILGLIIAVLALLRDAFDVKFQWSTSGSYIKRLFTSRRFQILLISILLGFSFWALYSRSLGLEKSVAAANQELFLASQTQTAQSGNITALDAKIDHMNSTQTAQKAELTRMQSTITAISTPPSNVDVSIDSISQLTQAITITQELDQTNYGSYLDIKHDSDLKPRYTLRYQMPSREGSYISRLNFFFKEPLDVSRFKYLEISIEFESGASSCHLSLQDINDQNSSIRIGGDSKYKDDVIVNRSGNIEIIKIPIETNLNSDSFNNTKVNQLYFTIATPSTVGFGSFTVSSIRFVQE